MLDKKGCHKEVLSSHIVLVRDQGAVGKEATNEVAVIRLIVYWCYIDPIPKKSQKNNKNN